MYKRDFTHFLFTLSAATILSLCLSLFFGFDFQSQQEIVTNNIQETEIESHENISRIPSKEEIPDTADLQTATVYITKTGSRYHLAHCRSLYQSQIPILLKKAIAQGYTPCRHCHPD